MSNQKYHETFYGHKVSDYGMNHGFVDYRTFAQCFNHVMNNTIIGVVEDFEPINGNYYDEEHDEYIDVYQWYIVDGDNITLELLDEADEIVYYSESLDVYLWGVTHWGTSWDYTLTSIRLRERKV